MGWTTTILTFALGVFWCARLASQHVRVVFPGIKESHDDWMDVVPVDPDAIELALPPTAADGADQLALLEFQVRSIFVGVSLFSPFFVHFFLIVFFLFFLFFFFLVFFPKAYLHNIPVVAAHAVNQSIG